MTQADYHTKVALELYKKKNTQDYYNTISGSVSCRSHGSDLLMTYRRAFLRIAE